jgi:hypothetical protein
MQILNDIDNLMGGKEMGETPSVIFNVPHYTPRNYNRELVFSQSWDLPVALFIAKNRRIQSGIVIDSRARLLNGLRIENGYAKVSDGGVVDFNNLWLYDFDSTTKQSSLTQLKNQSALVDQMIKWSSR